MYMVFVSDQYVVFSYLEETLCILLVLVDNSTSICVGLTCVCPGDGPSGGREMGI